MFGNKQDKDGLLSKLFKSPIQETLTIRESDISIGDDYYVFDHKDQRKYKVKSTIFSLRKNLSIRDMRGNELGRIEKKRKGTKNIPIIGKETIDVVLYVGNREVGMMSMKPGLIGGINLDYNNWSIEGFIGDMEYSITDGNTTIATIQNETLGKEDTFILHVHSPENELVALMITLGICMKRDVLEKEKQKEKEKKKKKKEKKKKKKWV